ncbi:hypothetical protein HPB48_013753 [Haemaphysalis longicornis]|uniref:Uncharacterized protein n=1 Tax=Haemaphysalis longicornis TaxID=44386 RepID=A0A9J6FBE7_HAELO|nr:hypothetical protein HPB48_013753 [Haemaphysalis longicornis]
MRPPEVSLSGRSQLTHRLHEPLPSSDELRTFQEIISHYKLGRQTYPMVDKQLSKKEEVRWRKLQTWVFPNPQQYSKCHPEVFNPRRTHCNSIADLVHIIWTLPSYNDVNRNVESWEALLLNRKAEEQRSHRSRPDRRRIPKDSADG